MNEKDKWISIGEIVAPQGLKGDVRIKPSSDFPERFTKPGKRWIQKANELPIEIKLIKGTLIPGKAIYVISIEGVSSRSSAEEIIGWNLVVPVDSRPSLRNDEYHYFDLIGLEAREGPQKSLIGHVTDLIKGGNDLLEIELVEGKKVLVPFVKEIVPEIEIKEKWLLINPPPGLLEL
ncbi:ribosome maturation factor RimM [Prochlorococcus marinus]|uniref:Ribosome maturation factor RimM n=1 Tax=Prochlorococcus marinus XMU1408 TaxID=2213228 RepID=A0A318R0E6_PROMR|nr:ribosome maturation factor RimM [Prochlorococcus marinus]MBW3042830.1 ribosome maturation factor RimM [Prochlorococcus marinus str. XMU1408]PYE00657.1 ribosome maturation factor RimM [Prochlorococcus marinus XMU1408]